MTSLQLRTGFQRNLSRKFHAVRSWFLAGSFRSARAYDADPSVARLLLPGHIICGIQGRYAGSRSGIQQLRAPHPPQRSSSDKLLLSI